MSETNISDILEELDNEFDSEQDEIQQPKKSKWLTNTLLFIASIVVSIPIFIIVYRYVPDIKLNILKQEIRIDHVITFLILFLIIRLIFHLIQKLFLGILLSLCIILTINQLTSNYGFTDLYKDYNDIIFNFETKAIEIPLFKQQKLTVRNSKEIKAASDYNNSKVRDFAVESSLKYFNNYELYREYGMIVRYFSVFKVINKWKWIPDPKGEEYYAKASESVTLLAGDCDDHSILMASCIKAIGGETRVVHCEGHLYPEVKVGKKEDIEKIILLIKQELFYKESIGQEIFFHIDSQDNLWLNFDYTGRYPGAKFMNNKIYGAMEL